MSEQPHHNEESDSSGSEADNRGSGHRPSAPNGHSNGHPKAHAMAMLGAVSSVVLHVLGLSGDTLGASMSLLLPLPMLLVGLSLGPNKLFMKAGMSALLAIGLLAGSGLLGGEASLTDGMIQAAQFGFLALLPAHIVAKALGLRVEAGLLLATLTGYGALLLIGCIALVVGVSDGENLRESFTSATDFVLSQMQHSEGQEQLFTTPEDRARFAQIVTNSLAGTLCTLWIGVVLVNTLIAQKLLEGFHLGEYPKIKFKSMDLPAWICLAFAVFGIIWILASGDVRFVAGNMALILAFAISLQGLAVIHSLASEFEAGSLMIVGFYMGILFFFSQAPVILLCIVALGMTEELFHFRDRFVKNGPKELD